ncbi:hypothetical protein EJ419_07365 [Alloscardovia theropitheci]|uniref:Uncharacterized protein n=1 Tax=Alloscardovia theropitheci TaxID=2496842 RepID=A0A4R0QUR0_9BIFI|nr:hypothetical protein [Alloscardovia theropitheci]TCD53777.1 hypothetical protein EJ419_07365 [Alloscardovia theropitheci]
MSIELITGKAGKNHISAVDDAQLNAALAGRGVYLLASEDGSYPTITVLDANTILIPVSHWLVNGRHIRITSQERLTITSGQTGYNRIDLLCFTYTRQSNTGIEDIKLTVVRGTPTTGTASAPSVSSPSLQSDTTVNSTIGFCQVSITGLVPTVNVTAAKLGNIHNISSRLDHVTSVSIGLPYIDRNVTLYKQGRLVMVSEQAVTSGNTPQNTHSVSPYHSIPADYRPIKQGIIMLSDHGGQSASFMVDKDGKVEINGNISNGRYMQILGMWLTA